ncbi:hypothetical protein BH11PLA2_BH11PLA2_47190 [soil metagenome]
MLWEAIDTLPVAKHIREADADMITDSHQAEAVLQEGKSDLVQLARGMLNDPYWPRTAANALGVDVKAFTRGR